MQSDDIGSHQEKCSIRDLQSLRAKGDHFPESVGSHSGSDNIETVSDHSDVDQTSTKRAKIVFDNNRKTSQTDIDRRLRLDVGVCSKKGHRKTMEDQHVANQAQVPTDAHFFAIYDGHGGVKCAEYLRDNLHTIVCKNIYLNDDPERALRESIAEVEHLFTDYSKEVKDSSGSTVAVSILAGSRLVCGNVGDSEIVLCRAGAPMVLTIRHVPNNRDEEARVIAAGGRMYRQRVGHPKFNPQFVSLAISRTIGDVGFKLQEYTDGKSSGIIADADTTSTELGATDQFLILACDGLWNVFSYQEAVNFCLFTLETGKKAQATVEDLVDEALRRGSTDNVTCLLVCFDHTPQPSNGLVAHSELSLISKEVFIAGTINPMCDD